MGLASIGLTGLAGAQGVWSQADFVNPPIVDNGHDFSTDIASDDAGNVVAIWHTQGVITSSDVHDVWVARSSDHGLTWSPPFCVTNNNGPKNETFPTIATDGNGLWIAAWGNGELYSDSGPTDGEIEISRSTDNGLTWSTPVVVNTDYATDYPRNDETPIIITDGQGKWMCMWQWQKTMMSATSLDNGVTWGAPVMIGQGAYSPPGTYHHDLATDGLGNWIATWGNYHVLGQTTDRDVVYSRSVDDGATWSLPAALNTYSPPELGVATDPCVVADTQGRWMMVWANYDDIPATVGHVYFSTSVDGGATWTEPQIIPIVSNDVPAEPQVATDGDGRWFVLWRRTLTLPGVYTEDHGLASVYSLDHGNTWHGPQLGFANYHAANLTEFPHRYKPRILHTGSGEWLSVWLGQREMLPEISGFDLIVLRSRFTLDSDQDLLPDIEESGYGTDPFSPDSDGDGILDGIEIVLGTDPTNPLEFPTGLPLHRTSTLLVMLLTICGMGTILVRYRKSTP